MTPLDCGPAYIHGISRKACYELDSYSTKAHSAPRFSTRPAFVMMTAISGQEADCRFRRQKGGPANGLWQFERGGGVKGVLTHPASKALARTSCEVRLIAPTPWEVWEALPDHDDLAAIFARLLLWTDAKPLPTEENAGWLYYLRNWRPGKPHPKTWHSHWEAASDEDDAFFFLDGNPKSGP